MTENVVALGDCPKCGNHTFLLTQGTDFTSRIQGKCYKCGYFKSDVFESECENK